MMIYPDKILYRFIIEIYDVISDITKCMMRLSS